VTDEDNDDILIISVGFNPLKRLSDEVETGISRSNW